LTEIKKIKVDEYLLPVMIISLKEKDIISIPTQIGCPINCNFCPSANTKFIRSLSNDEMNYLVEKVIDKNKETLISFTGEGESILNYKNVNLTISYLEKYSNINGFRICFSGFKSKNLKYISKPNKKLHLQFSIHSPFDEKRKSIMDKTDDLEKILENIKINSHKFEDVSFNYILIKDFNDTVDDLNELIKITNKNWFIKLNPLIGDNGEFIINKNLNYFYDEIYKIGIKVFKYHKIGSTLQNKLNNLSYEKILKIN